MQSYLYDDEGWMPTAMSQPKKKPSPTYWEEQDARKAKRERAEQRAIRKTVRKSVKW